MRRSGWMFLVVLGSVGFMHAQSSTNSMKLSGTVCDSACVSKVENVSTCDTRCTDKTGEVVLVDDQGAVKKIANPDMCKSQMGKHVKMTAMPMTPTEKQREETLRILDITASAGGGF